MRKPSIEDARHFQAKPPQANLHPLNASDVDNPTLTARAYGRKRGSFGKARGDLLLPEQETVSQVVSDCVRAAFARAGAIVVDKADPRFASARPVEVKINRFWSWFRPPLAHGSQELVCKRLRLLELTQRDGGPSLNLLPMRAESTPAPSHRRPSQRG